MILLLIAFLFSLHQVCVRKGTLKANTLYGTFISIVTTTLLFISLSALFVTNLNLVKLKSFVEFAVIAGILHFMLARALFYQCISRVGANVAATLATTRIFFSAFLGYVLLGESIDFKTTVMAVMVFLGVAVLTFKVVSDLYGIFLGVSTGFFTALASVYAKECMLTNFTTTWLEAIVGTALGYFVSLLIFSVFLIFYKSSIGNSIDVNLKNYLPFVVGGFFVGFGHFLRYLALSSYSVCTVETFISIYPIFTYILSSMFLRRSEIFNLRFFFAAFLIIAGVEFYLAH